MTIDGINIVDSNW